jgi:hypothetical protein
VGTFVKTYYYLFVYILFMLHKERKYIKYGGNNNQYGDRQYAMQAMRNTYIHEKDYPRLVTGTSTLDFCGSL